MFALFREDNRISEIIPTKSQAWKLAVQNDFVRKIESCEEDPPRFVMKPTYSIRPVEFQK